MTPFDWRTLPPLPALRAYEAAARLGSFSAAARVLNVTHPAVAQQVRGLERHLGLRLVAEAGRSLRLTEDGTRLAAALNSGFAAIAETLTTLRQADRHRGLRITLTPGFAQNVVIPALPEFWAAHPEIAVSLVPETRLSDLAREGFDLAIRAGFGPWPDGEAQLLCRTRMVLVGAPALLDSGADLAHLPWIVNLTDPEEAEWMAARGLDRSRLQTLDIENPMLAVAAALRGLGLMFATEAMLRDPIAAGQLRLVPGWDLPETAYWAVTPHGPPRAPVQDFLRWLAKRL
ncbi:LysR family transcriptional regulator [Rhodobacter sp. Har01]|uniref:LysR substrate-binding domain-containing protein n=1 Tax=Rhodobacter sp. Har01 TaxID=2883999 RepID=UPI001D077E1F|nr:LysR substrate-binding domain-containing protein [Rhodobacter sp. Har01]MCB6178272.1 LysR family transcriptional regulator [Rhodobacter sp. Har01]